MKEWGKGRRAYQSPPITRPNGLPAAVDHQDKCDVLRTTLFPTPQPPSPEEYPDLSVTPDTDLPYPEVEWSEVRTAIFTPRQNTAPGPCGTPFRAIRWRWKAQNQLIHQLFAGCCKVGHHPLIWKDSLSVALPKPNKPDYSQPRAYRLIAPGKSCTDAVQALVYDVKCAKNQKMVTLMLTLDITGFFDNISHPRLLSILRAKRIPTPLIKWTRSFLEQRSTAVWMVGGNRLSQFPLESLRALLLPPTSAAMLPHPSMMPLRSMQGIRRERERNQFY
jgi:hypothetical protein